VLCTYGEQGLRVTPRDLTGAAAFGAKVGGAIGALTVSFIQTGIVGVGLSGFYVQFFNGLIIILSLLGHRWNQIRYR
jgi:ribose/xylose/arabinose/galactoside ABC-type transport system permease subunit